MAPRRFSPPRQHQRGSALLLAVVLVVILAVVGLGVVTRASREVEAAGAKRQLDKSTSCADAARELLVSQFQAFGMNPGTLVLDTVIEDKRLTTGHYDNVAVTSVKGTGGAGGGALGASDMSNRVARTGMGGSLYRMTVVCSTAGADGGGSRQSEVEYVVRFGI